MQNNSHHFGHYGAALVIYSATDTEDEWRNIYNQKEIWIQTANLFFFLIKQQSIDKPPRTKRIVYRDTLLSSLMISRPCSLIILTEVSFGGNR